MEIFSGFDLDVLNKLTGVPVLAMFAILAVTDKLVWHTRLARETARADRWERVAIDALRTGTEAGVKAAEVTSAIVSALPDPNKDA